MIKSRITRLKLVVIATVIAFSAAIPTSQPARATVSWLQCNGHVLAVGVDYMIASDITDDWQLWNKRDELYFRTYAVIHNVQGDAIGLHPYNSPTISVKEGRKYDPLYKPATRYHCLPNGEAIYFNIVVREDDGFDFSIPGLIAGASGIAFAFTGEPLLGALALSNAKTAAVDLVKQLKDGPDDTIGAFYVHVANIDGQLIYRWGPVKNATMYRYGTSDVEYLEIDGDSGVTFDVNGDGGHYRFNVSMWVPS